MNPATGLVNNALNTIHFTIAFMNISDFDHPSKRSDIMSSTTARLDNSIKIVFKNRADAVLTFFDAAPLPIWSMLTMAFSSCV